VAPGSKAGQKRAWNGTGGSSFQMLKLETAKKVGGRGYGARKFVKRTVISESTGSPACRELGGMGLEGLFVQRKGAKKTVIS